MEVRDWPPLRQVRAVYTDRTVRVYQAYSDAIADAALERGTFVSPFKMTRMTWIKPSFCWMMCRAGWGRKEPNQKRILAIDITREGFEWILQNSYVPALETDKHLGAPNESPLIQVQWDPERDVACNRLKHRSVQIGLRGEALRRYVSEWIVEITDITPLAYKIAACLSHGDVNTARNLAPTEREYPVPPDAQKKLGIVDC